MDVADEAQVEAGVAEVAARLGGVDVLVSNAGIQHIAIHHHVTLEDVGAVAAFLVGDWAGALTGGTTYVDAGYHITG